MPAKLGTNVILRWCIIRFKKLHISVTNMGEKNHTFDISVMEKTIER